MVDNILDTINTILRYIAEYPVYSAVVGLFVVLLVVNLLRSFDSKNRIRKLFNIPSVEYVLIGTDLNAWLPTCNLYISGLAGRLDAAYINYRTSEGIAGEYKSRKYRGKIKLYERYQITLYMGMLRKKYNLKSVYGVLRYSDKAVEVNYDNHLYLRLLELKPEIIKAKRKGKPENPVPLHERRAIKGHQYFGFGNQA